MEGKLYYRYYIHMRMSYYCVKNALDMSVDSKKSDFRFHPNHRHTLLRS